MAVLHFFFQAEDGIRDLVRSRGLGDVYKRQGEALAEPPPATPASMPMAESPAAAKADHGAAPGLSLIHI